MKVYKCDSCGRTIENPYRVCMKEFNIVNSIYAICTKIKRRTKIHLCDKCYRGLYEIAASKESERKAK